MTTETRIFGINRAGFATLFFMCVAFGASTLAITLLVQDRDKAETKVERVESDLDATAAITVDYLNSLMADCAELRQPTAGQVERCNGAVRTFAAIADRVDIPDPIEGPQGEPGGDGVDGADGNDGAPGKTGPRGPRGFTGQDGADSTVPGPAGEPGASVVGPPGPAGPKGEKGDRGETGATGSGQPGADGEDALPFSFAFTVPGDGFTPDRTYRVTCSFDGCAVERTEG